MSAQIHTLRTGGASKNASTDKKIEELDELIDNAFDQLKAQLRKKFSEMLNSADQNLVVLSESADSNELKFKYLDLIHILRSERSNLDDAFFHAINQNSDSEAKSKADSLSLTNELSLVDPDEMDEMVAVTSMYSNAMNKYEEEVNDLETRIDYLEKASSKAVPKHTFNPRHICDAFKTALKQLEITIDYKLLLFKLFDKEVSSRLGDMYKSLNQLFIDAGVMPELVYNVNKQTAKTDPEDQAETADAAEPPQSARSAQARGSAPATGSAGSAHQAAQAGSTDHADLGDLADLADFGGLAADGDADWQGGHGFAAHDTGYHGTPQNTAGSLMPRSRTEITDFISRFMNGLTTAQGEGIPASFSTRPSNTDKKVCYSRNDVMHALSKLQKDLANADVRDVAAIDAEHIKRTIAADMGRSKGGAITKKVHVLDQRCIDFVGMMFHAITRDENISSVITNLLMLLQIPVIKAAMVDEKLFTENDHPARNTLDLITRAGRGVTDDTDRVFIELKKIVDGILQEYDIDAGSFEKAVDALETLIRTEDEIAAENERNEQREIIRQHARNVVLNEMRRITTNKKLPKSVQPLVLKHWPTMMCSRYMNDGIESHEWVLSLALLKLLMRCLQPINSKSQWRMLNNNHESLVEAVNDELYTTRQDREEIDTQISALQQIFEKMLDAHAHKVAENSDASGSESSSSAAPYLDEDNTGAANEEFDDEHDAEVARIEEQSRIAREKIANLPSELHPGVWFEVFNGEDGPVRRLKLSVVLTESARLIFVDRHGVKVIEKDAEEFLRELKSERSRFIADHSTFEHALGTVIHKLAA